MVSILVHFGAFWCTSCATPKPLQDLLWLLYPSRCPFNPRMDHISHSGKIRNSLLCHAILVHFGAFWCMSWASPWPLYDLLGLLSSFKWPFNPEMGNISHSGQIQNTKLCHAVETISMQFGAFWCIMVHLMCNPVTPIWLALTHLPFQVSIYSGNGSHKSLRTNSKYFAQSWYSDHFGLFSSILVHLMSNPTAPVYWIFIKPSILCILRINSF